MAGKRPRKVKVETMIETPPEIVVTESGGRIAVTGGVYEAPMAPGFVNVETEAGLMFFPPEAQARVIGRKQSEPVVVEDEPTDDD